MEQIKLKEYINSSMKGKLDNHIKLKFMTHGDISYIGFSKNHILEAINKRRLIFLLPIRYIEPYTMQVRYNAMIFTFGFINPKTQRRSVRSFLNKNSLLGQALNQYSHMYKSIEKSVISANDIFLNLKLNEVMNTFFDEYVYSSVDELIHAYNLDFKQSLTSKCDLYKSDKKHIIVLNDSIDVTETLNEYNQAITILKNLYSDDEYQQSMRKFSNQLTNYVIYHTLCRTINFQKKFNFLTLFRSSYFNSQGGFDIKNIDQYDQEMFDTFYRKITEDSISYNRTFVVSLYEDCLMNQLFNFQYVYIQ